jgi:hypothetical protein
MSIVTLHPNEDYLKRLTEIVGDPTKGITEGELQTCSTVAEERVLTELASFGFSISGWTTLANTPALVVEIIRMFAAALAWNRMLQLYAASTEFNDSYGAHLLREANRLLNSIEDKKILLDPSTRAIIKASSSAEGKGVPRIFNSALGINPTLSLLTDDEINDFIGRHGSQIGKAQTNPFDRL